MVAPFTANAQIARRIRGAAGVANQPKHAKPLSGDDDLQQI